MRRGRDIAPGRRAFYRRFEDEVLGYFVARGATPEVAADLTAETFAAGLRDSSWKRLAARARDTLDSSVEEGQVVADARRRSGMPPLVLTERSLARIAALENSGSFTAPEVPFEDGEDVRVRILDQNDSEQAAAGLRLSDAVARGQATDPQPERDEVPRIPELEDALVAAVPPRATRPGRAVALASAAAIAVLGFLVLSQGNGGDQQLTRASAAQAFTRSSEEEIIRVGNAWANVFAASRPDSCVPNMTRTACERDVSPAVKRSFRGATVGEVNPHGRRALVRFSNNVTVEFVDGGPHSPWQVETVGGGLRLQHRLTPEDEVTRYGNEWARLFASTDRPTCNRLMMQPVCERVVCVSALVENCPPPPLEFQRSFRDTTVREAVVKGRRAVVRFSNGVLVDFEAVNYGDGSREWWVAKLGRNAGRLYHEQKIVRSGNAWARFFAATTRHCVQHMTSRACGQVVSARFKRSFRRATVDAVVVRRGRRAAARFSNGELVEFRYIPDAGGQWWVDRLGPDAGRGLDPG